MEGRGDVSQLQYQPSPNGLKKKDYIYLIRIAYITSYRPARATQLDPKRKSKDWGFLLT